MNPQMFASQRDLARAPSQMSLQTNTTFKNANQLQQKVFELEVRLVFDECLELQ